MNNLEVKKFIKNEKKKKRNSSFLADTDCDAGYNGRSGRHTAELHRYYLCGNYKRVWLSQW